MKSRLIAIYGHGGFGREVHAHLSEKYSNNCLKFFEDSPQAKDVHSTQELIEHIDDYEVIVAVGNPTARKIMVNNLPSNTKFLTYVHSSAQLLDPKTITLGEGSFVCAGCILTTNIHLGKHTQLNLGTTIGHDVIANDYLTTAPGVAISGSCEFGERVYLGTHASIKEKTVIFDDVTVGLNAGVVKDIIASGVYVGTPAIFKK